jgi:predicted RNase H-like HicB family nuclease
MSMKKIIQVHIYKGDKYYIAECLDLPVVTQGKTLDELIFNLKEAINLQLEGENLSDFDLVAEPSVLANLEVDSSVYAKA